MPAVIEPDACGSYQVVGVGGLEGSDRENLVDLLPLDLVKVAQAKICGYVRAQAWCSYRVCLRS